MARKRIARKTGMRRTASGGKPRRRTAARPASGAAGGKFHGTIEIIAPTGGETVRDGTDLLVALRRLAFGKVPDAGKNEISVFLGVETDHEDPDKAAGSLKFDLVKYVRDGEALNVRDLLLFSGRVQRYLTLRCSIDELDSKNIKEARNVLTSTLGLAKDLASVPSTKTVLGGFSNIFGALLTLNEDDQIFFLNHSFYTENVKAGGTDRTLRTGLYTLRKRRSGKSAAERPQVELQIEIFPAGG